MFYTGTNLDYEFAGSVGCINSTFGNKVDSGSSLKDFSNENKEKSWLKLINQDLKVVIENDPQTSEHLFNASAGTISNYC